MPRQFDWDPAKRDETLRERAVDFAVAVRIFEGKTIEFEDTRRDYGERRMIAYGMLDGRMMVVVYTDRGDMRWIISARKANKREQSQYGTNFE